MKKNFRTMMLAMATLGLFSCSDKLADDAAQSQTGSADGFVAFQINNVGVGTRAADGRPGAENNPEHGNDNNYDAGEEYEYKITPDQGANVAFFFKASDGSYVDMSHLQLMSDEAEDGDHAKEKMYSARLRRDESTNSYYCVLILNADPVALEKLANKTLAEFMKEKDEKLGRYGSYFTMSNTVYIDDETDNTLHGPEKISKENICKTWEEAQEHKVKVHVERVVAKFGVNINITDNDYTEVIKSLEEEKLKSILIKHNEKVTGNGTEDDPYIHRGLLTPNSTTGEDGYTSWGIRIKNWGVNAKETETYFTKNLFDGDNQASDYPSAKLSKPAFGNWGLKYNANDFGWNDVTRVRSYWAVDPHYNNATKDVYPRQYRKAEDNTDLPYYTDDSKTPVLSYISYDNIKGSLAEALYAPENTFGDYSGLGTESQFEKNEESDKGEYQFLGDRYRWTGTHILVAAELLLGDEVDNPTEEVADKYCFEGVYWTESQTGENQAILKNRMVATLLYLYGNLFADDQGTTQLGEDNGSTYFDLVDATIDGGDGRRMLSPKQTLYKRVVTVGSNNEEKITYEPVNPEEGDTEKDFTEAIQQCTVQHFNKGKMYYAIPIEHMVALEKDKDTGKTTKFNIGSYGVVRNHWYQINIKTIDKPGTPVDKPGDEIVPNDDPKEVAYIAFEIVVIPWHVINQEVDF